MKFDKGRAKPEEVPDPMDSLEGMMTLLAELKANVKEKRKQYEDDTKHDRDEIKSLENIISEEVMKRKQTLVVGNIKAEYVPKVVFKMKKDKNDGE